MERPTPDSFISRLPGAPPGMRRQQRRDVLLLAARPLSDADREERARAREQAARSPEYFAELAAEIQTRYAPYSTLDVAAALVLLNSVMDPETYNDVTATSLVAGQELAVLIELASPSPSPSASAATGDGFCEDMWAAHDPLRVASMLSDPRHRALELGGVDAVYRRFHSQSRLIRNQSFDHQELELLRWLFEPFSEALREAVGVDVVQAEHLTQTIRLFTAKTGTQYLPAAEALEEGMGLAMSFDADQLAQATRLPEEAVLSYLQGFSVQAGDWEMPDIDTDTEIVRRRPLVHADERWVCSSPQNLLRAVRLWLEDGLKELSTECREGYQRHRAEFAEQRAVALVGEFMNADLALNGIQFGTDGECDGLVLVDDVAFVIEVKAGGLQARARPGDMASFRRNLDDLLLRAASQIDRARTAFAEGEQIRDADGVELDIDFSRVREVFGLAVTLEDLSFAAPVLWHLQDDGLLEPDHAVPWLVSLAQLELITQLLEFPAQLVHFLRRRQTIHEERFLEAADEIDIVMAYLACNLDLGHLREREGDRALLPSGSDELSEWVLYKRGVRQTPTRRPQLSLPRTELLRVRAALRTGADERRPGWLREGADLLEETVPVGG